MISQIRLGLFLGCIAITQVVIESATISVALYNSIPDLNGDSLNSYKNLVETEFEKSNDGEHKVLVVVDSEYDPYSNDLKQYLETFDIIEIDAVNLDELVNPDNSDNPLVMPLDEMGLKGSIDEDMFPAAVQAMTNLKDEKIYGYPTLLCGNLVTSIGPVSTDKCPINKGRSSLTEYKNAFKACSDDFIGIDQYPFKILLIGKMMDDGGWYLPYIYLDGYIDRYGRSTVQEAVEKLENGDVDEELCTELNWFIDQCKDQSTGDNICRKGPMSSNQVESSIVDFESVLMFSFSEKLAEVLKTCGENVRKPQALASISLGEENNMLQFTDGLVISKERWMAHDEVNRDAIKQFVKFFTSLSFRYKLAYGFDLNKPQVRYLLMPNVAFYKAPFPAAYDPIYSDARAFLQNAVPAPALKNKAGIQSTLEEKCLQPDGSKRRVVPKRKSEL